MDNCAIWKQRWYKKHLAKLLRLIEYWISRSQLFFASVSFSYQWKSGPRTRWRVNIQSEEITTSHRLKPYYSFQPFHWKHGFMYRFLMHGLKPGFSGCYRVLLTIRRQKVETTREKKPCVEKNSSWELAVCNIETRENETVRVGFVTRGWEVLLTNETGEENYLWRITIHWYHHKLSTDNKSIHNYFEENGHVQTQTRIARLFHTVVLEVASRYFILVRRIILFFFDIKEKVKKIITDRPGPLTSPYSCPSHPIGLQWCI